MSRDRHKRWIACLLSAVLPFGLLTGAERAVCDEKAEVKRDIGPARGPAQLGSLKCIGRLRPRRSEEIGGSRWGVSCHWVADQHELSTEQRLEQLARLGAKWALLVPNWDLVETEKGSYAWNSPAHRLDDAVHGCVKRKITPVIQIYGGNHLYTPLSPVHVPPGVEVPELIGNPEVKKAWYAWIGAMVRRYHQHVKIWEVWNEPNISWFWKPQPDAKLYGRMVKEVSEVIKSVDPEATVLAGSTAMLPMDFFTGLLDSVGGSSFDFCSMHPYGALPEQWDNEIRGFQKFLAERGKSSAIWQTECGFPSNPDTAGWGGMGPWNEVKHAKWVLRRLLCDLSLDMKLSTYFVLNDYPGIIELGPKKGQMGINRKGLYYADSWEPKHAAYAFQNLAGLLDDRLRTSPVKLTFEILKAGSFAGVSPEKIRTHTAVDAKGGGAVVAYWLAVPMETEIEPGEVRLTLSAEIGDCPVLVDLLDGRVYEIAPSRREDRTLTFENLPLADSPVVVCSRNMVELAPE